MMRKVSAFVDGKIYLYDCGGCGHQLVVTPEKDVGVCQGFCGTKEYFVPMSSVADPADHAIWKEWRMRSPVNMLQCSNCIALGLCGGGCPYSARQEHGSIWSIDSSFCEHAISATRFLLRDLMQNAVA